MLIVMYLLIIMHWSYKSIYRIDFLYTDRVRYNSARISSSSKFLIYRKFVFIFVFGFTPLAFNFVFKYISRKRSRVFSDRILLMTACQGQWQSDSREFRNCQPFPSDQQSRYPFLSLSLVASSTDHALLTH